MDAPYNTNSHEAMVKIQTYNPGGEACLLTLTASVDAASRAYPVLLSAAAKDHQQYFLSYLLQVTRSHDVCPALPTTVSPFLLQVSRRLHCVQSYCRCPDH